MICRHCQTREVDQPKGFCFVCWFTPGVVQTHVSAKVLKNMMVVRIEPGRPAPDVSTDVDPGAVEKLTILQQRALKGEELFHPEDYRPIKLTSYGRVHRNPLPSRRCSLMDG